MRRWAAGQMSGSGKSWQIGLAMDADEFARPYFTMTSATPTSTDAKDNLRKDTAMVMNALNLCELIAATVDNEISAEQWQKIKRMAEFVFDPNSPAAKKEDSNG